MVSGGSNGMVYFNDCLVATTAHLTCMRQCIGFFIWWVKWTGLFHWLFHCHRHSFQTCLRLVSPTNILNSWYAFWFNRGSSSLAKTRLQGFTSLHCTSLPSPVGESPKNTPRVWQTLRLLTRTYRRQCQVSARGITYQRWLEIAWSLAPREHYTHWGNGTNSNSVFSFRKCQTGIQNISHNKLILICFFYIIMWISAGTNHWDWADLKHFPIYWISNLIPNRNLLSKLKRIQSSSLTLKGNKAETLWRHHVKKETATSLHTCLWFKNKLMTKSEHLYMHAHQEWYDNIIIYQQFKNEAETPWPAHKSCISHMMWYWFSAPCVPKVLQL